MIQKPKGTKDILPEDSFKWQYIESIAEEIFEETMRIFFQNANMYKLKTQELTKKQIKSKTR